MLLRERILARWRVGSRGVVGRMMLLLYESLYHVSVFALWPVNSALVWMAPRRPDRGLVLHIGGPTHVLRNTVKALKQQGVQADFLAIGDGKWFAGADYHFVPSLIPMIRVWQEVILFWGVVSRYRIIHAHVMTMSSRSGWELPLLRKLGRKIVIHLRGCEARERSLNMSLHPGCNICEACDYQPNYACESQRTLHFRKLSLLYGDAFLVTTPDMQDFFPEAEHVRFFAPDLNVPPTGRQTRSPDSLRVFHTTTHPGIEGTEEIRAVVNKLREQGHAIEFVCLQGVPFESVLEECRNSDVSIGKMKMGYYANAQVESMLIGVPAITYIRPEFMTEELRDSGFIFSTLETLEETFLFYLRSPEALEEKRRKARASILALHDNVAIALQITKIYDRVLYET